MIGRALNGRYELVEILGVGGMATVFRALDHQLGRQVAVKVLNGGLADDPRFADRFGREAQLAAMLVHPRIAMVFDSGVDHGSPYIVMELVQGRTLGRLLAEAGPLPVDRAVGIAAAVCEALEVAHGAGLVHRDVKPGNIMITDDGGVKVVDFGIARANSSAGQQLTQSAAVLGTAAYLSPEQATASPLDGRSDLYAVGCVLAEMLTGEPPFTAATPVAIAFKHVREQPAPVSVRRAGIPPELDVAIMRLLAKDPADRPATAAAARAELLGAVPAGAVPDRTAELLGSATQVLPSVPLAAFPQHPGGFPQPHAAPYAEQPHAAPYAEQQRTSLLPPVELPAGAPYHDDAPPRGRRSPWLLVGAGAAVLGGTAAVVAFALGGPSGEGTAAAATPSASAAVSSATPAPASAAPAAVPSPSTVRSSPARSASPSARSGPEAVLAALRADVARADAGKERDRKAALLRSLDGAAEAMDDGAWDTAEDELKAAQRTVRDLARRHAIPTATYQSWQARLTALVATAHQKAG
ncbi:protein kinase domain-containing protein [Kitasatospora sp. NBC_01539]|uniref:protein kinase domain-containing protein n=1 Tax=Kitasatospora sp. NBC_01539 TaxID=2903577 RepID=UPI00386013F5